MEKFMTFTEKEFQDRAKKARKVMAREGIDACIFSKGSNITYFSGYLSYLFAADFRPFFFILPLNDEPVFVVPAFEAPGALRNSWCENARTWGTFDYCETADPIEMLVRTLRDLKLDKARVGLELTNGQRMGMTYAQLSQLQASLPDMQLVRNDSVVWECRRIKSPAELDLFRKCGRACDLGCTRAVEAMHVGATEKEVELAMCRGFLEGGGIPAFMTITSGPERNTMPNPYASYNKLQENDFLVMDFGCTYDGYMTDVTRGVFIKRASQRGRELFKAVMDIHEHVVNEIRPGVPICNLQLACNKRMKELGVEDLWYHRAGHAIGREIHELPSVDENDHTLLEAGMVLAVEPALYEYSTGPVRMEDNLIVTETGFEYLTHFSRDIIVTDC